MKNRKKILFLVTQSEFGGAQRFIYRLITSLNLSKYDILVAAGPEGKDANGLLFNLEKENFKVFPLKFLKRSINPIIDFLGILEIRKLIKKQNPDILFLCSTKAGFLGSLAARRCTQIKLQHVAGDTQIHADIQRESAYSEGQNQRVSARLKVIYRIGGWTFNDPWPKWKKKLYLWLEKKTARFKDFIVNNSQLESEQAKKLGIKPKKEILTIYNGIDVEGLNFLPKDEARKEILRGQNQRVSVMIGTIANLYPSKGLKYLIEAVKIIADPEKRFIIIGEGEERRRIEEIIRKNNLNNVFLVGAIPDAYRYLKALDAFILPSVKEGFPWTILEAMAAEIPVIATKVGAIPEIIEHKKSGILIESGNPQAIASAITELLNDEKLREDLVKEGRKKVCEKFTLNKMVAEYIKLFDA